MANIQHWLEQIRRAIYGREVRSSIANSIEAINKEQSHLDGAFNQLIINAGNSNAEVVAARVKADGTQFNTLGERLVKSDEQFEEINQEVVEARTDKAGVDHGRLKTRIDNIDEQLEHNKNTIDDIRRKRLCCHKLFSKLQSGQVGTIVFLGDSTTEQNFTTDGQPNHVGQLTTWLQGIYGNDKVNVINSGISGNTIMQMWQRTYNDVVKYKPDLVVICSGINDIGHSTSVSDYKKQFEAIIQQILACLGTDTDIIIRTPNYLRTSKDIPMQAYFQALIELCNKYNLIYADYHTYQVENNLTGTEYYYDLVHPNYSGQQNITEFLKLYLQPYNTISSRVLNLEFIGLNSKNVTRTYARASSINMINGQFLSPSRVAGAKETITFYGTGFIFHYTKAPSMGKIKITVDGTVIENGLDMYSDSTQWTERYVLDNLSDGEHTIVFELLADKNTSSSNIDCFLHGFFVIGINSSEKISERKSKDAMLALPSLPVDTSTSGVMRIGTKMIQAGFSAVPKGGSITFPIPFPSTNYVVNCNYSGGGGDSVNDTPYEPIVFTNGSTDYQVDKCYPRWASDDAVKGIKWIAIQI